MRWFSSGLSTDWLGAGRVESLFSSVTGMNISRMTFVRPVVVAVIAVGLAGCALVAPTESADNAAVSAAPEAPASDVAADQAVQADDDDEDVAEPDPEPEIDDWTQAVPVLEGDFLDLVRPSSPEPLIDYLPETSPLRNVLSNVNDYLVAEISSMTRQGAAQTARHTILGLADTLNDGTLEPVASTAATSCTFCMKVLEIAHVVHQDNDVRAEPWSLHVGLEAEAQMLSGPDHLTLKFPGEDSGLTHGQGNNVVIASVPGRTTFTAEMFFDQGQWWVLEVWLDQS